MIAPVDIRESARYIRLGDPDFVGGESVQGESLGLEIDWETEQHEPSDPYFSRFVTWEELGIDEDTYRYYGIAHFGNKPYTPSWRSMWVAEWGNEPGRASGREFGGARRCTSRPKGWVRARTELFSRVPGGSPARPGQE